MISYRYCFHVSGSIASRIPLKQGEAQASTAPKVRPRTVARRVPHVIVLDVKDHCAGRGCSCTPEAGPDLEIFTMVTQERISEPLAKQIVGTAGKSDKEKTYELPGGNIEHGCKIASSKISRTLRTDARRGANGQS